MVSVKSPPPQFDYRSEIIDDSRSSKVEITGATEFGWQQEAGPVGKERDGFGPVPISVEPDEIRYVGTSHISVVAAVDAEAGKYRSCRFYLLDYLALPEISSGIYSTVPVWVDLRFGVWEAVLVCRVRRKLDFGSSFSFKKEFN